MNFKIIIYSILCMLLVVSCKQKLVNNVTEEGKTPIVSLFNKTLYAEDINESLPGGLSVEDSTTAANIYVRKWINEQLVYEKAKSNTSDQQQIDNLVEDYRKSLTVYTYEEKLLREALSADIADKELKKYYDEHQADLKLSNYIIRGLFLKIPLSSPELNNMKKWYQSNKPEAKESIEKASIQNAVIYNYFYDNWVDMEDITVNIPSASLNSGQLVRDNKNIEISDSTYVYLLHIEEYMQPGSIKPFDYAKNQIRDILVNQKREDFINKLETDLYDRSLDRGEIKYYNKEN